MVPTDAITSIRTWPSTSISVALRGANTHPELHRPLTLREAAAIQTFPATYKFAGKRGDIERQIGNAVPVRMAAAIADRLLTAI
ncbi:MULTISPECIES: DNA cytosine methyltransferase [Bacteria]